MYSYQRLTIWSLVALALGICCGYFFSSRFCKISIIRRVEKSVNFHENLRVLFLKNAVLTHYYTVAQFLPPLHPEIIQKKLQKNTQELAELIASGSNDTIKKEFINLNMEINKSIVQLSKHPHTHNRPDLNSWSTSIDSFTQALSSVSPLVDQATIKQLLGEQQSLIIKEIDTMANVKSENILNTFENQITNIQLIADIIDQILIEKNANKL